MRTLLVLLAVAGCSKSPCERAVHEVFELQLRATPPGSEPKADEQAVIDQVERMTIGQCEKEGLSDAALACIMKMTSFDDMKTLKDCPGFNDHRPTWVIAP